LKPAYEERGRRILKHLLQVNVNRVLEVVAIGNVAVFTKEPYSERGLLGMDMLRLALERTRTA